LDDVAIRMGIYLFLKGMMQRFSKQDFRQRCDKLAKDDGDLAMIVDAHGYAPMWTRPNTFETLVHIILEQQVSLASALAALNKLRERLPVVTPESFLVLTEEELKACYFSRQKTIYTRGLAEELLSGRLDLSALESLPDDEVRSRLIALKGIGHWTIDVYLMFVLQRSDIFPIGDLAAINALRRVKKLPKGVSKEDLLAVTAQWRPNRTIAAMLLWHLYLSSPMREPTVGKKKPTVGPKDAASGAKTPVLGAKEPALRSKAPALGAKAPALRSKVPNKK
jgi:DNA-3-methyladenine glycosylase II